MKNIILVVVLVLLVATGYVLYPKVTTPEHQYVTLNFVAKMGKQPLQLNRVIYPNPGGEGTFKIRDAQLFISNLSFINDKDEFAIKESYHLLRFDSETSSFELNLTLPGNSRFDSLKMGVGVDPEANGKINFAGDLDPNGRMAWSWDVGYKFLLLEGNLELGTQTVPLVYHVGFDENYKTVTFPLSNQQVKDNQGLVTLNVDFLTLFNRQPEINMAEISTVKFDRQDAKRIAMGFEQLISLCEEPCQGLAKIN